MLICRMFAVLAFLAVPMLVAQENEPTACIGNDIVELRAASENEPQNIGLRMRIVRRLLKDFSNTDNRRKAKGIVDEVKSQLAEIKKLSPKFAYVYRVLARQHFSRGEYEKMLAVVDEYSQIAEPDYELRALRVRALLRLANAKDQPAPERKKEAAAYVCQWFDSEAAPVFDNTLAAITTWAVDPDFRKALLAKFQEQRKEDPRNINLAISYASMLYSLGRYESAWTLIHEAEKVGLCDDVTGGRHPLVTLLGWQCPEHEAPESFDGFNIDMMRKMVAKYPKNVSFTYRLAVRLKAKAYSLNTLIRGLTQRIDELQREISKQKGEGEGLTALRAKVAKFEKKKVELQNEVTKTYEEALPHALKAIEMNPTIDSCALLLGDIYSQLNQNEGAITHLRDAIQRIPFFVQLRDKLCEILVSQENWEEASVELIEAARLASCRAQDWKVDEAGSLLPVPVHRRERLMVEIVKNDEACSFYIGALEAACIKDSKNPNLRAFLSMAYFFAGDKEKSSRWMRAAEAVGLCGDSGLEHPLAGFIYSRESW